MPTKSVRSNQARTDLLQIYVMIGLDQPAAAERYFDRIEAKANLLKSQPRIGVHRQHAPGARCKEIVDFELHPRLPKRRFHAVKPPTVPLGSE